MPDLDERIAALLATTRERPDPAEDLDAMRAKRDRLRKRVEMIIASFDEADLKDAQAELARLRAERQQLDETIAKAEANNGLADADPELIAKAIKSRLVSLSANMREVERRILGSEAGPEPQARCAARRACRGVLPLHPRSTPQVDRPDG